MKATTNLLNKKETVEIGLGKENRTQLVAMLNTIVADEHLIYVKTRKFHWNIMGPQFYGLHELLERQYDEIKLKEDELAERVRMLGGNSIGTMQEFAENTRLSEEPGEYPDANGMLTSLIEDHEAIIAHLRDDISKASEEYGDEGTADLLIGTLRMHEQIAWMLRSTVNGSSV